jgi:3-hydroxyisobutyrate dehydrogenase-like beta-hydroxyacid dehydrogenase
MVTPPFLKRIPWVLFAAGGLALGVLLGVWYGWRISPVRYVNTTPDLLRQDYRDDYILMVAEVYSADHDLGLAVQTLGRLGAADMGAQVRATAARYTAAGYSEADLRKLYALASDLERLLGASGGAP